MLGQVEYTDPRDKRIPKSQHQDVQGFRNKAVFQKNIFY